MIRRITGILIFVTGLNMPAISQTIDDKYQIATWFENKDAVVTYTFDDNDDNQLPVALPLFDNYGYKVTFYTITRVGWSPVDWEGLAAAVANGHEVGVHTATHKDLSTLTVSEQRAEYEASINDINEHIEGYNPVTVAYPFCNIGDENLVRELFIGGRTCSGQIIGANPADFTRLSSFAVGSESSVKGQEDLNNRVNLAANTKGWAVLLFHGIDDDGGYSPIPSSELAGHLEYMNENEGTFWVGTFADVVKYIKSRNAVSVTEISGDEEGIVVQVSDSLDRDVYDQPITVMREKPESWDSVTVSQNNNILPSGSTEVQGTSYIWFNVIPDSGDVNLKPVLVTSAEALELPEKLNLIKNYPNPFNPGTTLSYQVQKPGTVKISIHDVLGKELEVLVQQTQTAGKYSVNWDGSSYGSGTYLYRYEAGGLIQTGKMQLVK